jgi:hypothetical protein
MSRADQRAEHRSPPPVSKVLLKAEITGGMLKLTCAFCGLQLLQPWREHIAERRPRCARWWR